MGALEGILGGLGALRELLGPAWIHLGAVLGALGAILGDLEAILGPSGSVLGALGAILDEIKDDKIFLVISSSAKTATPHTLGEFYGAPNS